MLPDATHEAIMRGFIMQQNKVEELLQYLEEKYPDRSAAEIFDLMEVVVGCNEIIETSEENWSLVENELLKRYGGEPESTDDSTDEISEKDDSGSEILFPEFNSIVRKAVRDVISYINDEAPRIQCEIGKKRKYMLRRVIEELQKLE